MINRRQCFAGLRCVAATCVLYVAAGSVALADSPGHGRAAEFEKNYLITMINHHYSALRMTELAAGTDAKRDAAVNNSEEGTSPTPGTNPAAAKSSSDEIKSMARKANRLQREEIVEAQRFLREWYGASHTPQLSAEDQQTIQQLEQTAAGASFDQAFLMIFSNHHYHALSPSLDCQVKADLKHEALKHYCEGIVENQVREINEMREQLCKKFNLCDFQPGNGNGNPHMSRAADQSWATQSRRVS